ncbi:Egt2p NDAI_0G01350 [Naumovozyma dairenensis CBS 421]|uniref:Uncharacterized protein n=1 Tax=Naumovozyma dairenensis (strain ATCC 10597 / BCRC 20456 / CBS 421 / NBRC 0211 / NRRL Y-12639) TaxID=1071378 RepID=G0WDQ0_NAUDC|nr:hypothetical protein NDAI_0G01350 [Naumovozyma dairenensis CBS 421]CCD25911.2 hypothetical protein NDAI_0G01350 [Naumovozyma dairenensis CBS 421]
MVSLINILLTATTAFASTTKYFTNTTTIIPSSPKPFFSDIQLKDAYSMTTNCTDPNHWFLVQAELFVPQGSKNDIYMTLPEQFGSFPTESFNLLHNSDKIGSVMGNSSNIFTISFDQDKTNDNNLTATFNFLTRLSAEYQLEISNPQSISFSFQSSNGEPQNKTINFIPSEISTINTNGGIDTVNKTAWFTIDIPIETFLQPVYFIAQPSNIENNSFQYNTALTTIEIVSTVGSFNQPITSVPFSAFKDQSVGSQIKIFFNTKINGGKYLRIKYFTDVISTNMISNSVHFTYPNSSISSNSYAKRDEISEISTTNLYGDSIANVDLANDETSNTFLQNEIFETYRLESTIRSAIVTEYGTYIPIATLNQNSSSGTSITTTSTSQFSSSLLNSSSILLSSLTSSKASTSNSLSSSRNLSSTLRTKIVSSSSSNITTSTYILSSSVQSTLNSSSASSSSIPTLTYISSKSAYSIQNSSYAPSTSSSSSTPIPTSSNITAITKESSRTYLNSSSFPTSKSFYVSTTILSSLPLSSNTSKIYPITTNSTTSKTSERISTLYDTNILYSLITSKQSEELGYVTKLFPIETLKNKTTTSIKIQTTSCPGGCSHITTKTALLEDIFTNQTKITSTIPAQVTTLISLLGHNTKTITRTSCSKGCSKQEIKTSQIQDIFTNKTEITSTYQPQVTTLLSLIGHNTKTITKKTSCSDSSGSTGQRIKTTQIEDISIGNSKTTLSITPEVTEIVSLLGHSSLIKTSSIVETITSSSLLNQPVQAQVTSITSLLGQSTLSTRKTTTIYTATTSSMAHVTIMEGSGNHLTIAFSGLFIMFFSLLF